MLFEIINPSDCYTLRADIPKVAIAAVIWLGGGKYGLVDENGENHETLLIFLSDKQVKEKFKELFGDFAEFLNENRKVITECLDSVMSVSFHGRHAYEEALKRIKGKKAKEEYKLAVHDQNRTSSNDIGSRAWGMATALKEKGVN